MRLQRLVLVYTCQNVKLLEISCRGSILILALWNSNTRAGEYKAQSGDRAFLLHIFVLLKRDLFAESSGLKPSTTHVPSILLRINKGKCAKAKRPPRETEGPLVGHLVNHCKWWSCTNTPVCGGKLYVC